MCIVLKKTKSLIVTKSRLEHNILSAFNKKNGLLTEIDYGDGNKYKYTVGIKLDQLDKNPIELTSQIKSKGKREGIGNLLIGTLVKLPCRKDPLTEDERQRIMTEERCCYGFRR